jgi:hypothetical protein
MVQGLIRVKTFVLAVFLGLSGTIQIVMTASAEESPNAEKHRQKTGLLAVSSISGAGSSVVGEILGEEDIFSGAKPPISGSVSKISGERWMFVVENNSPDQYKIDVELIQRDVSGSTVKFSSYSYSLHPKSRAQETVSAGLNASRAELFLRSSASSSAKSVR